MTAGYREAKQGPVETKSAFCPKCKSKRLMLQRGVLSCTNCGHEIGRTGKANKYGAKRTEFNGKIFDSKFEATEAAGLELRKRAGDILDYDTQFKVELQIYDATGKVVMRKNWKVDFRIHELDGSFTLYEAKGLEGTDYKWKRDILTNVWLPEHPEYEFEVVKQGQHKRRHK